jgi:hypothetical protein
MPKPQTKLPRVFLACPFDKDKDKLVRKLNELPWKIEVATDKITNNQIIDKITKNIRASSFAIFDISGWNANVCLELGLARGIDKKYYIINNPSKNRNKDVPSDIKGIDRIDYNWNKKKRAANLFTKIKDGIFKKNFITKAIWDQLHAKKYADKKFQLALNILNSFKQSTSPLKLEEVKGLAKGFSLREPSQKEVIAVLVKLRLFKKIQGNGAIKPKSKLYR